LPQTSREHCGRHPRSRENFSTERTLESDQHLPKTVRLSVWHMPIPRACSGRHKYAPIAKVSRKAVTRSFLAAASASSKSQNHPNSSSASVFNKLLHWSLIGHELQRNDNANSTSDDELYVDMVNPKSFDAPVTVLPNLRVLWAGTTDSRPHGHRYHARCGRNYVRL
jgi:hypothetical protein